MAKRAKRRGKLNAELSESNRLEVHVINVGPENRTNNKMKDDLEEATSPLKEKEVLTSKDRGWQPINHFHHATNEELIKIEREYTRGKFS